MSNTNLQEKKSAEMDQQPRLHFLSPNQMVMIDEALAKLGEYGEVRLIVEKGRLRFVVTQKSYDVLKWQYGEIK